MSAVGPLLSASGSFPSDPIHHSSQHWDLLRFSNFYRLIIAGGASLIGFLPGGPQLFGTVHPELFRVAAVAYFLIGIVALATVAFRRPDFDTQATLLGLTDIATLSILLFASGGVGSGAEILLVVAVTGLSLMLGQRITLFYAALATLAVLGMQAWEMMQATGAADAEVARRLPQAGLLGAALFAASYIGHVLAERQRDTHDLARRQESALAGLAELNSRIVERIRTGIIVCDGAQHVRVMNHSAARLLDLPPNGIAGPRLDAVAPKLAALLGEHSSDGGTGLRQAQFTTSGHQVLVHVEHIGHGPNAHRLILLDDMAALEDQARQLRMSALARLSASLAHELRNPLGALANAAQLLAESDTLAAAQDRRLADIIQDQSRRMTTVVANVTQLSRRDRVQPATLTLRRWLPDFVARLSETDKVPREAIALVCPPDIQVTMDADQLEQVLGNLVRNALMASPPYAGAPLVKLQAGRDDAGHPILDVIDWGAGIPTDAREQLFEPFFTTKARGTGLGLFIARELCEGNGARLGLRPGPGTGTCFRILFAREEAIQAHGTRHKAA